MKQFLLLFGILLLVFACRSPKEGMKSKKNSPELTQTNNIEYALETYDARFKEWFAENNGPELYKTQEYYEYWNRQYVVAWNTHSREKDHVIFEPIVGYTKNKNYGMEVNHQLFYYFQFVENVLKIQIMKGGPKVIQF
jgi:hypothetical protein